MPQIQLKIPKYFIRSGSINIARGSIWYARLIGYAWSSVTTTYAPSNIATAYWLELFADGLNPSRIHHRHFVLPIRCLAY